MKKNLYIILYGKGHSSSYCIRFLIFTSSSFLSCKDDGSLVLSSEIGNSIELYPSIFNSALYSSSFRIESQQLFCQYASTVMALCFRILHRSDSESGDCDAAHIKTLERKKFLERISDVAGAEMSSDAWVALRCCCAAHSTSPFCHTASTVNYTDLWCTQWAKEHATTERWSGAIAPVVVWPAGHVTRERHGRPAPKYLRSTRSTTPKNLLLLPFLFHFSMLKCYSNGVK